MRGTKADGRARVGELLAPLAVWQNVVHSRRSAGVIGSAGVMEGGTIAGATTKSKVVNMCVFAVSSADCGGYEYHLHTKTAVGTSKFSRERKPPHTMAAVTVILALAALCVVHGLADEHIHRLRESQTTSKGTSQLDVVMSTEDGSLTVTIGGQPWFTSSGGSLSSGRQVSSSKDGSLALLSVSPITGTDSTGSWRGQLARWAAADSTPFETSVRVYETHAIFAQRFPTGVKQSSEGQGSSQGLCRDGWEGWCRRDELVSGFPLLRLSGSTERGVVSFQGIMSGYATTVGTWEPTTGKTSLPHTTDPVGTCRVRSGAITKGVHADTSAPNQAGFAAYTPAPARVQLTGLESFTEHLRAFCDCTFALNGTCAEWVYTDHWSKRSDCAAHCRAMNCSCFDFRAGVNGELIGSGIEGSGPVVLFGPPTASGDAQSEPTVVLSAASNFMAASQTFDNGTLAYGVMGAVTSIPANYSLETLLSVSEAGGVNRGMEEWGDVLLQKYAKQRYAYRRDLAMQKLGYSTDNGAYYYYLT